MPSAPLDLASLPSAPGVYRFRDAQGRVMYIGRAVELRRRVRSYWGSQKGRPRMRRMVPQVVAVEVAVCASEHEAAWLERNLLEQSKPRWNRARGGLEVPTYLRLDPGARTAGLTALHEPQDLLPHFGPYLGGTRVRTAVSALASLYPLAYARDGLRGAEQAMAEARRVGPADRDRLHAALNAILAQDAAALDEARGLLQERRTRAAADLEFEQAGRIQEQLEALDWLASPQQVTDDAAPDATIAGWSDGVLVEFTLKGGRLRKWTQRTCDASAAEPRLAATPPAWADFAQRNADVAAQLRATHHASTQARRAGS